MKNKQCQICGETIPNRIILDGKVKILSSRKRCLKCSPYGNQGKKTGIPNEESKSMSNYRNWKQEWKDDHIRKIKEKGNLRKKELVEKAGGSCLMCGYNKSLRAMSFHHREPSKKIFGLNSNELSSRTKKEIQEEFDKCDLLCVRCHAELEEEILINKLL